MKQLSLYAAGPVMLAGMAWFLAQEKTPDLTRLHVPEVPWEQPKDPRVVGVQAVTLTDIALERLATGGGEVVLPLPSGERLTVHLDAGELTTTGGRVHRGMVENNPDSIVLLVEEEGLLAGSVDLADGRFFTLLHAGMGRYRLETVDLARAPICEEDTDDQGAPELTEEGGIMAEDKVRMLTVRRPPIRPETAVNGLGKYIRINLRIHPRRTITQPVKKPLFTLRPKPTAPVTTTGTSSNTNRVAGVHSPRRPAGGGGANINPGGTGGFTGRTGVGQMGIGNSGFTGATGSGVAGTGLGGDRIDLLMAYMTGAENAYGGVTGIKSAMQLAVQQANTAFARSGVNVRLNLVHITPINYRSVGRLGSDLHNVTFKDKTVSGYLEDLRKKHRADLVSVVSSTGGGGVGWLLIKPTGMRRFGYHVLGNGSLRGYVLAHEVGHNLGCQHARGDSGVVASRALFPYGFGHRFQASDDRGQARHYRTVMAYAPGRRVGYFSNPAQPYRNVPTGTTQANNAAVLAKTVKIVSAYYQ